MSRESAGSDAVVSTWASPGHLLRRAQRVHTALWNDVFQAGLTGPQYATMVVAALWPGQDQQRAGELAALDKATMNGVISRLEKRGFIQRRLAEDDRRRRLLLLTGEAERQMDHFTGLAMQVHDALMARLPKDGDSGLIALLQKIAYRAELPEQAAALPQAYRVIELPSSIGYLLRRAQQVHVSLWNGEFGRDITGPQYAVLSAVAMARSADQLTIAEMAGLDPSSAGNVMVRMEKDGWLRRIHDSVDRRRLQIELTQPARLAIRWASPGVRQIQDRLLQPLSSGEGELLVELLQHLVGKPAGHDPHKFVSPIRGSARP